MNKIRKTCLLALALCVSVLASATGSKKIESVNSTQLYPLFFPGYLSSIKATGKVDFKDYKDQDLVYGLDYVVMRYDYPRFSYVELGEEETLQCGCYLTEECPYVLAGNTSLTRQTVDGYFLRYNPESLRFELKKNEQVNGLEAYIATNSTYPVNQIAVGPIPSALKRVYADDGTSLSVKPTNGGAVIHSASDTSLPIYNASGQLVKIASLDKGANTIDLPRGLYVAGGVKFSVR